LTVNQCARLDRIQATESQSMQIRFLVRVSDLL
jgi:hypothetical protein